MADVTDAATDCSMTETLPRLLLRLSEAGDPAVLWGRQAATHAGRDFERLLDHGVLVEQPLATAWDVCPACDCDLDARPIQRVNGRYIAACPTDRRSDVVLGDDDLRSFRVHALALVREIATASGFGDEPSPVAGGVWHLGQTSSQRALFLALSRDAVLQPGLIGLMRSITRSLPIAVIAPAMAADDLARFVEAGIAIAATTDCFGDADAAGFAIDLSTLESAPAGAMREGSMSHDSDGSGYDLPRRLKQDAYTKSPAAPQDTDEWRAAEELEAWRSVMPQYEFRDGAIHRRSEHMPPASFTRQ